MRARTQLLDEFQQSTTMFHVITSVFILSEAIDLPKCDSEFMSSVGDTSNDLLFFQRSQRGATPDHTNPNKKNHIFLWAHGLEQCVGALQYLREADPTFHKKLGVVGTRYDVPRLQEQSALETREVSRVMDALCETVEERFERRVQALIQFAEQQGRLPKSSETHDSCSIGQYWNNIKQGLHKQFYIEMFQPIQLFREDYDRVQSLKKSKKVAPPPTSQETADALLQFAVEQKRLPKHSETLNVYKIGQFWRNTKQGRYKQLYTEKFQPIQLFREEFDRVQTLKKAKETAPPPTSQETAEALLRFAEQQGRLPKFTETHSGCKIGTFWQLMKQGQCKQLYIQLFQQIQLFREEYDRVRTLKKAKETSPSPTSQDTPDALVQFAEEQKRLPKRKESFNGCKIGHFWNNMKQGRSQKLYTKSFEPIQLFREEYERVQEFKAKKLVATTQETSQKK